MRTLHVAALPFPSAQGTQAALHAMLSALHEAGQSPELLCYAHGAHAMVAPYPIHRLRHSLGVRSLRSGPSPGKLALDLLLAQALRRLVARAQPAWVVAHHVEAASACVLAGVPRFAFVAHTSLGEELRFYVHPRLALAARRAGIFLDRFLCRRAARVLAVAPGLARELASQSHVPVAALRLPWPLPPAAQPDERARARCELGLAPDAEVVLYAGNLDAYQGLPALARSLAVLVRERPHLRFLLATQAAPDAPVRRDFPHHYTREVGLGSEADRRRAHAAADVVVVPRASSAGLPVKLLDALARGAPVVAARRAAAGLALDGICALVDGEDPEAFARAIARALTTRDPTYGQRARAYIASAHSNAAFLDDFRRGLGVQGGPERLSARSSSDPFVRGDKVLERP